MANYVKPEVYRVQATRAGTSNYSQGLLAGLLSVDSSARATPPPNEEWGTRERVAIKAHWPCTITHFQQLPRARCARTAAHTCTPRRTQRARTNCPVQHRGQDGRKLGQGRVCVF